MGMEVIQEQRFVYGWIGFDPMKKVYKAAKESDCEIILPFKFKNWLRVRYWYTLTGNFGQIKRFNELI